MKKRHILLGIVGLVVLSVVTSGCISLFGAKRGEVSGQVTWNDGSPVVGAMIQVGNASATTGEDGTYRIEGIPHGTYDLTVSVDGKVLETQQVTVGSEPLTVDIKLSVDPPQVLWQYTFDQGTEGWEFVDGEWAAEQIDGRWVLRQSASSGGGMALAPTDTWDDYRVEVDVLSETEGAGPHLLFRVESTQRYYFARMRVDHQTVEVYVNDNGDFSKLATESFASEVNKWYRLGVTAVGDSITVYVDGEPIIELTDDTISSGRVGFRAVNTVVRFADIVVSSVL